MHFRELSPLPVISGFDVGRFLNGYMFHRTGAKVDRTLLFAEYSYAMWVNLRNRVILGSTKGCGSYTISALGPADSNDHRSEGDEIVCEFTGENDHWMEARFNLVTNDVRVLPSHYNPLTMRWGNLTPSLLHEEEWRFSEVLIGSDPSANELLMHGLGYEPPGIGLPLAAFSTVDRSIHKFVLPDGRSFFSDGSVCFEVA